MDTPGFYKIPFSYFNEHKIHEELDEALFHNVSIELLKLYGENKTAGKQPWVCCRISDTYSHCWKKRKCVAGDDWTIDGRNRLTVWKEKSEHSDSGTGDNSQEK